MLAEAIFVEKITVMKNSMTALTAAAALIGSAFARTLH